MTIEKILEAEKKGAAAVIVYAFGDVGIKETRNLISIPVMGLGKAALHMASLFCQNRFTVIPAQLIHNDFLGELIKEENLQDKYIPASHAIHMSPWEVGKFKKDPIVLERLVAAASAEITENNVDTFTMGCGSFIGMAKPLEQELRKRHKKKITVIDPIEVPFKMAKALSAV